MTRAPSVIVMAKAPRAGRVKTRLHPLLGPQGCAQLAATLLAHTLTVAAASGFDVTVAYDPPDAAGDFSEWLSTGCRLLPQCQGDLGDRMAAAAAGPLGQGRPAILIGTDAPTLQVETLLEAAERLERADVAFGPAADGGYYLVGLARAVPEIFQLGPIWGGPSVLHESLHAASKAGVSVSILDMRRDLDTPQDVAALLADPALPPTVRQLLSVTV